MKKGYQIVCNACDSILEGYDGTAKVQKRYISIKGSICLHYYDKYKTKHHAYDKYRPSAFDENGDIKPFTDFEYYDFCSGFCLDDFMGQQLIMKSNYHKANNLPEIDITNI